MQSNEVQCETEEKTKNKTIFKLDRNFLIFATNTTSPHNSSLMKEWKATSCRVKSDKLLVLLVCRRFEVSRQIRRSSEVEMSR
ncbi:hypothetical protein CAJAP_06251 [Camponotus japonicus]